jgi:hypothetical protein
MAAVISPTASMVRPDRLSTRGLTRQSSRAPAMRVALLSARMPFKDNRRRRAAQHPLALDRAPDAITSPA